MKLKELLKDKLLLECIKYILLILIATLAIVTNRYPDTINELFFMAIVYWAEKAVVDIPFKKWKECTLMFKLPAVIGGLAIAALLVYALWPNMFVHYWENFIVAILFTLVMEVFS